MTKETPFEKTPEVSNERAVAWARRMMANKRAEQQRMQEEYKTNYKLQEALAKLREKNQHLEMTPRPYEFVIEENDPTTFAFETTHYLTYEVRFKNSGYIFFEYPALESNTFELVIRLVENATGKRTPPDLRIAATIADIFRTFLIRNERIVVYICDSSDLRQAARARKFDGWYEHYRGVDFIKIDRNIVDPAGEIYWTSLIIRHDNPNRVRIFEAFDRLTSGQNEEKS